MFLESVGCDDTFAHGGLNKYAASASVSTEVSSEPAAAFVVVAVVADDEAAMMHLGRDGELRGQRRAGRPDGVQV
ncbi:hypothetical protein CGRA01v4_03686 [Colletotrichum graminicola]|uniref:Uncharacterized protein n=1 Tax=Colletotrichum graminicola (strain M1.001 / M2 / FGSC 10212) TaxID=645133 RepID=E3QFV9_COLGM|nr:uncharacterized protein GLRG_04938 [Colletotrichum graminicola M1.001]EFQ29794.1 hypothetical protein GLRG_04938 [Colletotrichum graminicola M1.001]WDK12407.1 hypothetical protein CGRA01v4_03686 [Colletotrichum graminicola]